MKTLLTVLLVIHIASGIAALFTGFLSMRNTKGGKRHRLTGKVFFFGMTGVFITATAIALIKGLAFLLMVGFFSYYLACSGYRSLYLKKLHLKQRPKWLDWFISIVGMVAGLGLIAFSYTWFTNRGGWGTVPLVFGGFCLIVGISEVRKYYVAPSNKSHWIISHGTKMGASFAASVTAFVVTNVNLPQYGWVLWILPGVLVGIWISRVVKPYSEDTTGVRLQRPPGNK